MNAALSTWPCAITPQVRTESVGVGENRKVTIIPKSYKR